MEEVKVSEIAEESGATVSEVISKASDLSINLNKTASVSVKQAEDILSYILTKKSNLLKKAPKKIVVIKKASDKKENAAKTEPVVETTAKAEVSSAKSETVVPKAAGTTVVKPTVSETIAAATTVSSTAETVKAETKTTSEVAVEKVPEKIVPLSKYNIRKRGITIIKKNSPVVPKRSFNYNTSTDSGENVNMKSMSALFGSSSNSADNNARNNRAKKQIRYQAAQSHQNGIVLDTDDKSFGTSSDSLLGEEVVLFDMGGAEVSAKFLEDNKPRKPKNTANRRPSAFGNQRRGLRRKGKRTRYTKETNDEIITDITIPEQIRVYEFAEKIAKTTGDVIGKLFALGNLVTKNDFLSNDEIEILGDEYELNITIKDELEEVNEEVIVADENIDESNYVSRPPVITIMGHVDHGKTSLLDKIRKSRVAQGEAGGITQHISAYTIKKNDKELTFIDTPGHAAFSSMRVRGADITDIIILVVAADDGVKPQTIESIKAARASKASIIVAVNKIDKEAANMDMVKSAMAEQGITPSDWGGDIDFVGVSALTGEGIENLLEQILLQAEVLELKADPTSLAKTTIIESSIVKGRGAIATIVVQSGTLRIGDNIVAGTTFGRVKALLNDSMQPVKELSLSQTGQVVGLDKVPATGTALVAQDSALKAKNIATKRAEHARAKELSKSTKVSLEEMAGLIAEGKIKALPVIIKADASGSLEAIKSSLEAIKNDEVKIKIINSGVGGITESDLSIAGTSSECIIIGFNVRPTGSVKSRAKSEGIEIKTYTIIYELIDDIKNTLSGMMSEIVTEENTGQAEIRNTFVVPKIGTVAGCIVSDGKVIRGGLARVIREGVIVYTGKISSLKRFKDDVKEVSNGYECGIMFEKFNDVKVGDYIETFIEHKEQQTV